MLLCKRPHEQNLRSQRVPPRCDRDYKGNHESTKHTKDRRATPISACSAVSAFKPSSSSFRVFRGFRV